MYKMLIDQPNMNFDINYMGYRIMASQNRFEGGIRYEPEKGKALVLSGRSIWQINTNNSLVANQIPLEVRQRVQVEITNKRNHY